MGRMQRQDEGTGTSALERARANGGHLTFSLEETLSLTQAYPVLSAVTGKYILEEFIFVFDFFKFKVITFLFRFFYHGPRCQ